MTTTATAERYLTVNCSHDDQETGSKVTCGRASPSMSRFMITPDTISTIRRLDNHWRVHAAWTHSCRICRSGLAPRSRWHGPNAATAARASRDKPAPTRLLQAPEKIDLSPYCCRANVTLSLAPSSQRNSKPSEHQRVSLISTAIRPSCRRGTPGCLIRRSSSKL